ncbi:MAG TPA: hypothetical protein VMP38_10725 [Candidatus Acidoferrum sp.]|nr:hypothetical protein [Candidatus Acidoferrum sp.]
MTLSPSTHLNPPRRYRPAETTHGEAGRRTGPEGTLTLFPPRPSAAAQLSLMVEFTSPDGRTWQAIGGGDTLSAAIAFAQDSCPTDAIWQPISWTDLYGD